MNVERNFDGSYASNNFLWLNILQSLGILHGYFEYLSPKIELKDLHSAKQRVFSEKIADGKITAELVKAKRIQIPAFHRTDLRIRDKVRSIIKAKLDNENDTQDKEELLPGN